MGFEIGASSTILALDFASQAIDCTKIEYVDEEIINTFAVPQPHYITYDEFKAHWAKVEQAKKEHTDLYTSPVSYSNYDVDHEYPIANMIAIIEGAIRILETYGWTQGKLAVDGIGEVVGISEPSAESFCAEGSLLRSTWEQTDTVVSYPSTFKFEGDELTWATIQYIRNLVAETISPTDVLTTYNDHKNTTKEDVILLFKNAIGRLGEMQEKGIESIRVPVLTGI